MINNNSKTVTVEDIQNEYPTLGIPHFQRGLVWNDDSVSSLLQSLYEDIPCGSFVLWECNNKSYGKNPTDSEQEIKYLIVDGQQRIRSIIDAISKDNNPDQKDKIWCVNLKRLDELSSFYSEEEKEFPLFMKISDPRKAKKKSRFSYDYLPIELLINDRPIDSTNYSNLLNVNDSDKEEVLRIIDTTIRQEVKKILKREFFIKILDKKMPFEEVISIYNRINSGGKKVEAEEQAFAALVSVYLQTNDKIFDLFNAVHKKKEGQKEKVRDDVYARIKERNFGFKFFMRVFILESIYHLELPLSAGTLSFNLVTSSKFKEKLNSITKIQNSSNAAEMFWNDVKKIVLYIKSLLNENLFCDSFQFLPETNSLLPIIQLCIRYPRLMDNSCPDYDSYRKRISALLLKLYLAELTQRDVLRVLNKIKSSNNLEEIIEKVIKDVNISNIKEKLEHSNSLQDRYVLLLYWLVRKNKAMDFSYSKNNLMKINEFTPGNECVVSEEFEPEKQHIVPYSLLMDIFEIDERTRLSTHAANNIGNITYISQKLNSSDYGLSNNPLNLDKEPDSNLHAHLLDKEIVAKFNKVINSQTEDDYKEYYQLRNQLIAESFENWCNKLYEGDKVETIEPVQPYSKKIQQSLDKLQRQGVVWSDQKIRDAFLEWDNPLAKRLIDFITKRSYSGRISAGSVAKQATMGFYFPSIVQKDKSYQLFYLMLGYDRVHFFINSVRTHAPEEIAKVFEEQFSSIFGIDLTDKKEPEVGLKSIDDKWDEFEEMVDLFIRRLNDEP